MYLKSGDDYGSAWLTDAEFSNGTIELDVKGKDQPGKSFVGVAFHSQDNATFDAVYLRPFNFRAKKRSTVATPFNSFRSPARLQRTAKELPGKYESALSPAPQSWVS